MPAKIDLQLTLPDGDVTSKRHYPLDREMRDMTNPDRQADERKWVISELPGAIEQLYARAGLMHPDSKIDGLLALLPDNVHHDVTTLEAVVSTFGPLRDALHETAAALGVDLVNRQADGRTGTITGAANLPRLAKQKVGDLARAQRRHDELATALAKLAQAFPVRQRLPQAVNTPAAIADATLEALADRAREVDERSRHLNTIKDALRISHDVPDEDLAALVTQLAGTNENDVRRRLARLAGMFGFGKDFDGMDEAVSRDMERRRIEAEAKGRRDAEREILSVFQLTVGEEDEPGEQLLALYAQQRQMGQRDVLAALGVDASEMPAEADLTAWGQRTREAWQYEDTRSLTAELEAYRGHLATLLADLGVGKPQRHEDVRSGAIHAVDLATLVTAAQSAIGRLHEHHESDDRLNREMGRLLNFFDLPRATADEKLADRIIEAARKTIGEAADGARSSTRKVVENEIVMLRAAFTASAQMHQSLTAVEGAAVRNGIGGETLKSMIERARAVELNHYSELAVLRHLAAEVSQMAGGSADEQRMVSSGELKAQPLANMLRDAKAKLRKDYVQAERDSSRRILTDIAAKLGHEELRPTLLPGAVGDLVRTAEAQQEVLDGVRRVLAQLRDGLDCPDSELPGLVRQTALTEGYPVGTVVELETGDLAMVVEISADPDTTLPIVVRMRDRAKLGVRVSEIERIRHDLTTLNEQPRPGEFFTADGVKAKAFHLPENGLADILAKVRPPKLPDLDKIDAAADKLADRIETWGERVANRINSAADRLAAEIDDAVEKAREKGGK